MDHAKPSLFILVFRMVLMPTGLALSSIVFPGDLSAQRLEVRSAYRTGDLAASPASAKISTMVSRAISTPSASGRHLFPLYSLVDMLPPGLSVADDRSDASKSNPVAGWLEVTLRPVHRWLRGFRRSNSDKPPLAEDGLTKEVVSLPSAVQLEEISSKKLNQAIAAATDQYRGVLLSVKRVTIEQAIYRIKILRQSGELRTLDYSEEQDQFISEGDESWYANTVD